MSDVMAFKRRHGEVRPWFAHQAVKHRSPLTQAWMTPFSKPVLILSDYREAQDIFLRRGRDFFRGPRSCDNFRGLIPEHHIAMMSADPRFKRNKELVRDLMTPGFLHQVSAPEIHNKSMMLVDLWAHKSRLAQGMPFDALADMFDVAVDMINAATFALDDDMSTTKMQLDFLLSAGDSTWTPVTSVDARGAVSFPRLPEAPDIEACRVLSEHVGALFNSLAPRLEDRWRLLTSPRLRACVKRKDRMISREIERSVERMASGDGTMRSALDHLLQREQAAATREGRKPEFHSRKIYDELLGYIVAGHETSATGLCWMIKLLATHQDVQATLRATLRAGFASAASESRQPTADEITLTSVPYLDAVLEESLRYAPPIPLLIRTAMVDTTLLGYPVPKGTNVFMPALGPGYTAPAVPVGEWTRSESSRTKGWGGSQWDEGDMHRFRPERWLQVDEEGGTQRFNSRAGPMITFGLGPRSCFGKRLAYLEMRMVLSLLVWNFEFQKLEGSLASNDVHESITTCPKSCYVALKIGQYVHITPGPALSLDALINNAGGAFPLPILDADMDKARSLFDLNVFSVLLVTRAYVPLLLRSETGGLLINHTLTGSQTAGTVPFHGIYNASKAAVASLTEGLRLELAPFGIKVVNLVTGAVKSNFFDNAPRVTLPPNSLYNVAKEDVEKAMSGEHTAANGTEASVWAEAVVRDINRANPPHWVWQGRHSTEIRLASHLPVGTTDSIMRKVSKLDILEQKIKEKGLKQE